MEHKMEVHQQAEQFNPKRGSVITIGTFDGVHFGHRAILKKVVDQARARDLNAVLLTFFPHPRMVVQKQTDLKLLNTLQEKIQLLEGLGIDHLVIHPFTKEFSRLTAVEFVRDLLVNQLKAKKIIIGYDHRFGRNRTANIDDLKEFGIVYDFEVEEISAQQKDAVAISSTKIRKAIESGDVAKANAYLGEAYSLSGTIIHGQSLGHSLGYPTANFVIEEPYKLIPKQGVYLSKARINGQDFFGVTNIGTNPTVGGVDQRVETHFLGLSADLYNRPMQIYLLSRIRDQKVFPNVLALKSAIAGDIEHAQSIIPKFNRGVV
jgi:riboflavin kinase/FMN adenylyltransferase